MKLALLLPFVLTGCATEWCSRVELTLHCVGW